MSLEEIVHEFNIQNECSDQKMFISDWLHSKGILASVIKCNTLTRYIDKGDISKGMVWKCVKAHIFYTFSFECIVN